MKGYVSRSVVMNEKKYLVSCSRTHKAYHTGGAIQI